MVLAALSLVLATEARGVTIGPIPGDWDGSESQQTDRMWRDGVPSDGTGSKAFPGELGGGQMYYYETYTFLNNGPAGVVDIVGTLGSGDPMSVFFSAFLGTGYDPIFVNNGPNYLGDGGSSPTDTSDSPFSILVPANSNFLIVANSAWPVQSVPGSLGDTWSFTVTGDNVVRGVVPEPLTIAGLAMGLCGAAGYLRRRCRA